MISVQVSYRIAPHFIAQNIANINTFLADFKTMAGFSYHVYVKEDGLTFIHMSEYDSDSIQEQVLNVPSFLDFQRQRDPHVTDTSHRMDILAKIGSSVKI